MNLKKHLKNQRGVTLVALVVTIVVLIILGGVTITKVVDNNGTINQAKEATKEANKSMVQEELMVALTKIYAEQDVFDYTVVSKELPKKLGKPVTVTNAGNNLIEITYKEQTIVIDDNLNIQE